MATDEQIRNVLATVGAMVDGAAGVMQRLHPEVKVRSWNELSDREQAKLAEIWQPSLAPLGAILTGRPVT